MFVGVSNGDKFLKVFPTLIIYPFVWFGFLHFWKWLVTFKEKVEFCSVELKLFLNNHNGHVEWEH